jgi:hypothetical protein
MRHNSFDFDSGSEGNNSFEREEDRLGVALGFCMEEEVGGRAVWWCMASGGDGCGA